MVNITQHEINSVPAKVRYLRPDGRRRSVEYYCQMWLADQPPSPDVPTAMAAINSGSIHQYIYVSGPCGELLVIAYSPSEQANWKVWVAPFLDHRLIFKSKMVSRRDLGRALSGAVSYARQLSAGSDVQ
jgi:hypothetical protein